MRKVGVGVPASLRGAMRSAGVNPGPSTLRGWLRSAGGGSLGGEWQGDAVAAEPMQCARCGFAGVPYDPENIPPCPQCGGFMTTSPRDDRRALLKGGLLVAVILVVLIASALHESRPHAEPAATPSAPSSR